MSDAINSGKVGKVDATALRAEDFFLHGGEYADHVDKARPSMCETCAFRPRAPTVRPAETSLRDLVKFSGEYDAFVCHERHEGETLTCRGWLAYHHPDVLLARAETEASTDAG